MYENNDKNRARSGSPQGGSQIRQSSKSPPKVLH